MTFEGKYEGWKKLKEQIKKDLKKLNLELDKIEEDINDPETSYDKIVEHLEKIDELKSSFDNDPREYLVESFQSKYGNYLKEDKE